MTKLKDLTKRQIRYLCFRLRTEAQGGVKADNIPKGFKENFEKQECFTSWDKFGDNWDINISNPTQAISRNATIHQEWRTQLDRALTKAQGVPDGCES